LGDSNGDSIPEENTSNGQNIYVITAEGSDNGGLKRIQAEAAKVPPLLLHQRSTHEAILKSKGHPQKLAASTLAGLQMLRDHLHGTIDVSGGPTIEGDPPSEMRSLKDVRFSPHQHVQALR